MNVPIQIKAKSRLLKIFSYEWLRLLLMLIVYWVCIWIVLTLFGIPLSLWSFVISIAIYFIYQELIGDLHKYAMLSGGNRK